MEVHLLVCYVALPMIRLMRADAKSATGIRPFADAVVCALFNMSGRRLDANVCKR